MHNVTGDWTKVVVLCALLGAGCTGADGVLDLVEPDGPDEIDPVGPSRPFSATGYWEGTWGGYGMTFHFWSSDDDMVAGDFTGWGSTGRYGYDYFDVDGHWEHSTVSMTLVESRAHADGPGGRGSSLPAGAYSATLSSDYQTTLFFQHGFTTFELQLRDAAESARLPVKARASREPVQTDH